MDLRLASTFVDSYDFYEGMRCVFISKGDTPRWSHKSPLEVTDEEVEKYFMKLPIHRELKIWNLILKYFNKFVNHF